MGLPQHKSDSEGGINTPLPNELKTKEQVITDFLLTPLSAIRKYIPKKRGLEVTFCYKLLIVIAGYPRQAAGNYRALMHTNRLSVANSLDHLLELGLIKSIGRPRLIVPFQKFKVDKAYVITDKGKNVIKRIMLGE